MTAPEQDADLAGLGKPNEQMQGELGELLSVARVGELAPTEFLERLESIHARYLGKDALAPEFVSRRGKALAAYDEVRLGVDRHHQLELLAHALGVEL